VVRVERGRRAVTRVRHQEFYIRRRQFANSHINGLHMDSRAPGKSILPLADRFALDSGKAEQRVGETSMRSAISSRVAKTDRRTLASMGWAESGFGFFVYEVRAAAPRRDGREQPPGRRFRSVEFIRAGDEAPSILDAVDSGWMESSDVQDQGDVQRYA